MVNPQLKKKALHRLKILRGQIDGLMKAIDAEVYCTDLLAQSRSVQQSLKSLDAVLLENHLRTHVTHQMQTKGEEERAVKELIQVYTLSNK